MIKLVIFDLDGTLINTIDDITNSVNYALIKNDIKPHTNEEVIQMIGYGVDTLIARAIRFNIYKLDQVKNDYISHYYLNNTVLSKPYEGIKEELNKLKNDNIKLAVLSNKPDNDTKKIINYYFPNTFDYVLGKKEENNRKPLPDGVNEIKNNLNIYDSIIMVGDSSTDIKTGILSNLKTIGVLWGYRGIDDFKEANKIISKPSELYKTIKELEND